jgi:hypothetical protein
MFSNSSFEFFVSAYIAIDVTFNILDKNPRNILFHKWQSILKIVYQIILLYYTWNNLDPY